MKTEIIIVGAGAAGLMAARKLAKAGKKVIEGALASGPEVAKEVLK